MKTYLALAWSVLTAALVTAQEPSHNIAQLKNETSVTIPNDYTPFGNRVSFNRFGDDGSSCIVDPNGVLTWLDNKGTVRILPNTELAVPLFVTNTECLVWNNRFVDYDNYASRPKAEIKLFRAVAGSDQVTSQTASTQGVEVAPTSPITTTTGSLNFITYTRKDNGLEGGPPATQIHDDCDVRVYRMTASGGVQFIRTFPLVVLAAGSTWANTVAGPVQDALGFGSDGSLVTHVSEVIGAGDVYFWFDSQGRSVQVAAGEEIRACILTTNTRLVVETAAGQYLQYRRGVSGTLISTIPDVLAGIQGDVLNAVPYTRTGSESYFFTVDAVNQALVRTYRLLENGIDPGFTRQVTLPNPVNNATVVATYNPLDGSALIYGEDGVPVTWLHSGLPAGGLSSVPNSGQALPLYVTNEQCVIWENARAPLNGDGSIPPAIVTHYKRDVGTGILTPSSVNVEGRALLGVIPYTPAFAYWNLTTAEKINGSTVVLRTYLLGSANTVDSDSDGLLDAAETNTGIYVSPTDTGSDPSDPDTDKDGILDGDEVYPYSIVNGAFTWQEAKADALLKGGKLASVTSSLKLDAVKAKLTSTAFATLWLGGSDIAKEGTWVWENGEAWSFANWAPGQPDNLNNADALVLQKNQSWNWTDNPITERRGYLLERIASDPTLPDTDSDGLDDGAERLWLTDPKDTDTDNDGLTDGDEVNVHKSDPTKTDTDGDGLADGVEVNTYGTDPANADTDNDGVSDADELTDGTNPLNKDTDGDGLLDGEEKSLGTNPLDTDTDNDGLTDGEEVNTHQSDPLKTDTDADGLTDGNEVKALPAAYYSPYTATSPTLADTDGDRLTDKEELDRNPKTNPNNPDTDGDGITDGDEVDGGTDPGSNDSDADGLTDSDEKNIHGTDPLKPDTDGDGLKDGQEIQGVAPWAPTDPLKADTDGDGYTDGAEVTANTDPNNYYSRPGGNPPVVNGVYHRKPVQIGEGLATVDQTWAPFGHRPETDKVSEDGSVAIRDVSGAIIWVDRASVSYILPGSSLGKTLYVSNTECVVWTNRFDSTYNSRGSFSEVLVYRRDSQGKLVVSAPIQIPGTLLETCAVSPGTYGFTLVGCVAQPSVPVAESQQRYQSGLTQAGPIYNIRDVDIWDERVMTAYRLTLDNKVQVLADASAYIPRNIGNVTGIKLVGNGSDASMVFSMTVARDFFDDTTGEYDADPGIFKSMDGAYWATWIPNSEQISTLAGQPGVAPLVAFEDPVEEMIYVSNRRVVVESAEINPNTDAPTGNYKVQDIRQRDTGEVELYNTYPLPSRDSVLPLSPVTRPGLIPYFYVVNSTGLSLSLYRVEDTMNKIGNSVTLPAKVSKGSPFARNPRDASLLVKVDGATGLVWIPSIVDTTGDPIGLSRPLVLPNSRLGRAMFVSSVEAVGWMNADALPDLANGGIVPLSDIKHFESRSNGVHATSVAPPALGRYVAGTPALSLDAETEGWVFTTFEKTSDRTAKMRTYRLYTDSLSDSDGDGLLDTEEEALVPVTDPHNTDSDRDGITDGLEVYPYYVVEGSYTYKQAQQEAIRRGGWLAVLDTPQERAALKRLYGVRPLGSKLWVGGGDFSGLPGKPATGTEGQYVWVSQSGPYRGEFFNTQTGALVGTPMVWTADLWAPGQPTDAGNSDGMLVNDTYLWEMSPELNRHGFIMQFHQSSPTSIDTDGDSLTDREELDLGTNPNLADTDGDGVSDVMEVQGYQWSNGSFVFNEESGAKSSPLLVDTDGDGISDADEVRLYKTDPTNPDTDGDGLTDYEEIAGSANSSPLLPDTDGDGFTDYQEMTANPPTNPNDPNSRPQPGQLVPPNPNMHNQVELIRQQNDVTIPFAYSPFGNRSDYNRFGDDGSAMILDVNGVLLWQDAKGVVRTIPNSEYAVPLVVSGSEAIVWTNAFDPARATSQQSGQTAGGIQVAVYRVDPGTGQIGTPTSLTLPGQDILPTAPITTTSQAYTLITFNYDLDGMMITAYVNRMTYAGNAQLVTQISIPSTLDDAPTARQGIRALGHGSDGSVVFSADPQASFKIASPNDPLPLEDQVGDDLFTARHRRIFWVNGSTSGPSGVVEELSKSTRIENYGDGSLPARVLYSSASRVVYQTSESASVKDARRNSITGSLTSETLLKVPTGLSGTFLRASTQTRQGDTCWIYAPTADFESIVVCRLTNVGLETAYTATMPEGFSLDPTAVVYKINPQDGSAILTPDNTNMLWLFNNFSPTKYANALLVPNSKDGRPVFVQRNELVIWGNARNTLNSVGALRDADVRHFEQKDGKLVNPTNGFTNLSTKIDGGYVLDTPPYTPGFDLWTFATVDKASPTSATVRYYKLNTYAALDSDNDKIPDVLEVQAGTNALISDTDGDGLSDGDELYPYYVINGSFTWEQAKADATARGGRVAAITNQDDYTAMCRRFGSATSFNVWLGATDEVVESTWLGTNGVSLSTPEWVKHSPVLDWSAYYANLIQVRVPWAVGKPDNANNADALVLRSDLTFEDRPVTELRGYIIEYPRTNPKSADSDGDGMTDGDEIASGTNPTVKDPFTGVPVIHPGGNLTTPVPFAVAAGSFDGLSYDPNQGHVYRQTVSVTSKGAFTVAFNGLTSSIRASLRGTFSPYGYFYGQAPSGLPGAATIELQMVEDSPGKWIVTGVITTTTGEKVGLESRKAAYSKAVSYPLPGRVTMAMPLITPVSSEQGPAGDAVGVGSIDRYGKVSLTLYMPDGGKTSYSGSILDGDLLALRAVASSPYKLCAIGPVDMDYGTTDRDFGGSVRMYSPSGPVGSPYPSGFEQKRSVIGNRYYAPTKGYMPVTGFASTEMNAIYAMDGGDFGGIFKVGTWAVNNKSSIPQTINDSASVGFTSSSGLVTFSYTRTDPERQMIKAKATGYAVALQKVAKVSGYYYSGLAGGRLTVTPNDGQIPEITAITPVSKTVKRGDASTYTVRVSTPYKKTTTTTTDPTSGAVTTTETPTDIWTVDIPEGVDWVTARVLSSEASSDGFAFTDGTGAAVTNVGAGDGTVEITVNPNNPYGKREAVITIAGIKHRLTQEYNVPINGQ